MRRDQLEHAIRTACQVIQQPEVIVVGSQAILGTYDESQLPDAATMSIEVDILPVADTNVEAARLADLIEGVAGELLPFEELHGFSIDGVDLQTASHGSRACASTRKTCASPSWPPSARRTATSSPRCSKRTLSTPTSSPNAFERSYPNTQRQSSGL